jgi:hypothetical protein
MGCGCKNKAKQISQQNVQTQQQSSTQQVNEALKKQVEKYYNKK